MDRLEEKTENQFGIKNVAKRLAPAALWVGGLVGWGVCANKGYAPSGLIIFGITTLCSIGLANILGIEEVDYDSMHEQTNYDTKNKDDYTD